MKKIFYIVILISVVFLGFFLINEKHHNDLLKEEVKKQKAINKKEQLDNQNKESTTKHSTVDKKEIVKEALLKQPYVERISKYNDVDVKEAMRQPTTPPNLIHDGTVSYYFNSDNNVTIQRPGSIGGTYQGTWSIDDHKLTITTDSGVTKQYTYKIQNNKVKFDSQDKYGTDDKWTSEFIPKAEDPDK
ncbi:hypothetical protein [Fructobacillus parabroussonetiae]|uniref:Lipoprotein n=1 Tax=Fructobacillus parabroussonetiae TaxID=2713174 RepID=A0ABS5QZD4_9LACO|nr:hypothetical protein [Fructobacillus parabroussonetiae]MBS9338015.1 hypothetical protein [Fructobacillus parabroussonetiae]